MKAPVVLMPLCCAA